MKGSSYTINIVEYFFIVMISYFYMYEYNQIFVMISLTKYFFICSYSMLSYSFQLYI